RIRRVRDRVVREVAASRVARAARGRAARSLADKPGPWSSRSRPNFYRQTWPRKAAENLPEGLDTVAAFLGQTSQKFGRLRLGLESGLSAELLEGRSRHGDFSAASVGHFA